MTKKTTKVAVQKGPIVPVEYTYRFDSRENISKNDAQNAKLRFDGQKMEFVTPKQ